ncbi:MAG: CerR family C-terminal domain-containing protein, partial [Planctomycetota bacterium]|nr:CerR family C-terminal domain-containing protein [Planctomycetota bacterium]
KGFSGVTAREVAGAAGVALSAIPYHFGSMEALYHEAILVACQASPDAAPLAAQARAEDPEVGLRTAIRWAIMDASSCASSWQIRLLYREDLDPSPAYKEVLRIKVVPEWNWLCEVVARAAGCKPDSPEVKFGVIDMYNLTASLHIRSGMIDHLAPDVVASISQASEAYIECMSRLTLDAVSHFAAAMSVKKSVLGAPARARQSAGTTSKARIRRSSTNVKGRES